MTPVDIAAWDPESRRRFDRAIELANRFWSEAGAATRIRLDGSGLTFSDRGRERHLEIVWGGVLLSLASLPKARAALMFRGRLRLARAARVDDPTVSGEAKNHLLIRANGKRREFDDLCGFLVHELTHVQQEARSRLGAFSFGLAYLGTLGIPYEREADGVEERVEAFVRATCGRART